MTDLYVVHYERTPKTVSGDLVVIPEADGAAVLTSSAFRVLEARRTDRRMEGPFPAVR
jgi:hypothetical protein